MSIQQALNKRELRGIGAASRGCGVSSRDARGASRAGRVKRSYDVLAWGACAMSALGTGLVSSLAPHRIWGFTAAVGHGCAGATAALRGAGIGRRHRERERKRGGLRAGHQLRLFGYRDYPLVPWALLRLCVRAAERARFTRRLPRPASPPSAAAARPGFAAEPAAGSHTPSRPASASQSFLPAHAHPGELGAWPSIRLLRGNRTLMRAPRRQEADGAISASTEPERQASTPREKAAG